MKRRITGAALGAVCAACVAGGGMAMATGEAKYTVEERKGAFELRRYEPQIVAETVVEGEFGRVGNEGFRRLFRYISGGNRAKRTVAMTAPVAQEAAGEKLPMTAPVAQEAAGGSWRIAFVMPEGSSLEGLPEPLDARVT